VTVNSAFIKDCVITDIADDYENFEHVFTETKRVCGIRGLLVTEAEVANALRELIAGGYAEAYLLSPRPPHSAKTDYAADRLTELWFYVTPKGKSLARGKPELSGEVDGA